MEIQLLHTENISRFSKLCGSWAWEQVLDQSGNVLPGCAALGCVEKGGKPCGLVLASPDENREVYTIQALQYNHKVSPEAGEALLRALREHAALNGIQKLVYSYTAQKGAPDLDAPMLRRCGWTEPKEQKTLYRIEDAGALLTVIDKLNDGGGTILPFFDMPVDVRARFSARFGGDIDARLDYNRVWSPDPELSLACVEDGSLMGYVICSILRRTLEVQAAYIEQGRLLLLGSLLKKLAVLYRPRQAQFGQIDVYIHTALGGQILQKLLGRHPHQQLCFMESEFDLMRGD